MQIQKAFKYRLRTDPEIEETLRRFAGSCRFIFNRALALQQANHEAGDKFINYVSMAKNLTDWRHAPETEWLSEAPVHPLQQTLKDLERAYKNFFAKRADFPRFKKRGQSDSFRFPDPKQFQVDQGNSRIKLPKLGWLRYRNSRVLTGIPKNVTLSLHCGHWYISIQTEQIVPDPVHPSKSQIGIDRGINVMAAMSDGTMLAPLNIFKQYSRKLARLQRQLARKIKFSENWKKCKAHITKLHGKIAAARKDFLNKTSTTIAKNHGLVVLEDLKILNMSASAKGTIAAPGRKVKQKAALNKSILDQGWGEFARQLEYKLRWLGGQLVKVPAAYTSQTCSCCGHVQKENRNGLKFKCLDCGFEAHADTNAAYNILAAGLAVIACGEHPEIKGSVKQEPSGGYYALAA